MLWLVVFLVSGWVCLSWVLVLGVFRGWRWVCFGWVLGLGVLI